MGYLSRVFHASEEANRGAILRSLPRGSASSLLDLGTHRGDFTERLAGHVGAERVAGVELIERHAAVARSRGIEVAVADLDEGIPFPSGSFDIVNANQVIEHVRRTDVLLREMRRHECRGFRRAAFGALILARAATVAPPGAVVVRTRLPLPSATCTACCDRPGWGKNPR